MIFIDPLFFEFDPVKIPNVFSNKDIKADVARFIGIYEKQCLQEVLGECLYKEVQDSFVWDADLKKFKIKDDATTPIKNLVNGFTYEAPEQSEVIVLDPDFPFPIFEIGCGCGCGSSACKTRIWKGFVQEDEFVLGGALSSTKRSFIAEYVYYYWLLENRTTTAPTGQQVLGGENSATVPNFSKRIDRYNEFVFAVIGGRKGITSLYRFLTDNRKDYPTWICNGRIKFKPKY